MTPATRRDPEGPPQPSRDPLEAPSFLSARWPRAGYHTGQVDEFVADVRRALRLQPPGMAPYEVADQRFTVVRVGRGYDLKAVDDYLDRAERLLRQGHGADPLGALEGRTPPTRHVPTAWIYLLGLVLVAVIGIFAYTQL